MGISFRLLTPDDIPICLNILLENYPNEQWENSFLKDIEEAPEKKAEFIIVSLEDTMVGFGCFFNCSADIWALTWINIYPHHQKKGIGKQLVIELERRLKELNTKGCSIVLETDKPNFYKRLKYITYHKVKDKETMIKYIS